MRALFNVLIGTVILGLGVSSFAKVETSVMSVESAIKHLSETGKKSAKVVVSGEISAVCQAKGCWLTLKPSGSKKEDDVCTETLKSASTQADVRVMFGDHAFTVPKDLKGEVVVHGELKKKKLSSFQLKHLMKDAGCSKAQMKKVKKALSKKALHKYQIVATDVFKNGVRYNAK